VKIEILSLFPAAFQGPLDESIVGRAQQRGVVEIDLIDLRDYAKGRHRVVDDRPYGGGPGMVLKAEPVVEAIRDRREEKSHVVYLSPQGTPLHAAKCRELADYDHLILLCGHYEGIDQRAIDLEVDEEISIGDYVLTSGCLPAMVLLDATIRFVPGVLGHAEAAACDSFEEGLFDAPHFTRPEEFEGQTVPLELLSGSHERIERWRRARAVEKTAEVRPDLYWSHMRELCADLPEGQIWVVADIESARKRCKELGLRVRRHSRWAVSVEGIHLVEGDPSRGQLIVRANVKQDQIDPDGIVWWVKERE